MRTANLILHCGATAASREQVEAVVTPARTRSWVPVGHGGLLGQVQGSLERSGLHVVSEAHGLTRDGARYFGLLQVANGETDGDFGLVIGLRNAHDRSTCAGLCLGASVFVCDNMSFSGEVKIARKHTVNIHRDLPQLVERAVGLLVDQRGKQEHRFQAYRNTELSDRQAHDLLIQALDARVVPVTQLPAVLHQWRTPEHPEFAQEKNAWRLFNAFTAILRDHGNLQELPHRTQALNGILDQAAGLVLPGIAAEPQVAQAV